MAGVNAEQVDKPNLWDLTVDNAILAKGDNEQGKSRGASGSITPNNDAFSQLAKNSFLTLPLPGNDIQIKINDFKKFNGLTEWSFEVTSDKRLPKGKLFIHGDKLSAWIPTTSGTWRLSNGQLNQEVKWTDGHGHHIHSFSDEAQLKSQQSGKGRLAEDPNGFYEFTNTVQGKSQTELSVDEPEEQEETESQDEQELSDKDAFNAVVKVLFVVTPEFEEQYPEAEDVIQQIVSVNNAIYDASGVKMNLEVATVMSSDLESYSATQILDNLARSVRDESTFGDIPVETLQPIWEARLESEADIVSVLTFSRLGGLCGKSWLNGNEDQIFNYRFTINVGSAFTEFDSGTVQQCPMVTLGHEIGHNMGLGHSHQQGEVGEVFHYGRGYGLEDEFATVMAYPQAFGDAVALPLYSSPELTCLDEYDCGISSDLDSGADAVKALNEVRAEIARLHNKELTLPIDDALDAIDESLVDCLEDDLEFMVSNEELTSIGCVDDDVESFNGLELFPHLTFVGVNFAENASLDVFKNHQEIKSLDLRFTRLHDLRPIVHLRNKLEFLQFFQTEMSCQDVSVVRSWGIGRFNPIGQCVRLEDDDEDFDNDGIDNLDDTDDDNDGLDDLVDALPFDDSNADDIDADGIPDSGDAFPYDPNEFEDTDQDTIGNNSDLDDDNDGVEDDFDCAPLDPLYGEDCDNLEPVFVPYDFDADGKADVGVRRASNAYQYIRNSSNDEIQRIILGRDLNDISVSGDFDGDLIADVAVRRPSNQLWYIKPSSGASEETIWRVKFGLQEQDIPVPADYDGDGVTDVAVRRPSTFQWFVRRSSDGEIGRLTFGRDENDIPVPADYDGDGLADVAVRRPSNQIWYILNSSDGEISRVNFGLRESDIPVPADYDGDGVTDFAIRRASELSWYILRSSDDEIVRVQFAMQEQDIPVIADYDGDGKADIAVRRPSEQTQYILRSSDFEITSLQFGLNTSDMPLAAPVTARFFNDLNVSKEFGGDDFQSGADGEFRGITVLTDEEALSMGVYRP